MASASTIFSKLVESVCSFSMVKHCNKGVGADLDTLHLDDMKSPFRSATISGSQDGIERANKMVQDIISEVNNCYSR